MLNSLNHLSFVNISRTLTIDTSIEGCSRVLQHGNPKFWFKKKNIEFWRMLTSWNHFSFVNISPTLVIDTSMERSSRILQHAHGKCEFYKIKVAKARKISSVKRHFPRLFIGVAYSVLQMLAVHHGSNISTCSRRISFTRLVIIPLVPRGKSFCCHVL